MNFKSARTHCELLEHHTACAREEELSISFQMLDETRQNCRIQLSVDIVDDDGKVLNSFTFNMHQRRETERRRNHFYLTGAEHVTDRSTVCAKTQIMSVWTFAREPCPSVPRSRLIIPFLVVFFHL